MDLSKPTAALPDLTGQTTTMRRDETLSTYLKDRSISNARLQNGDRVSSSVPPTLQDVLMSKTLGKTFADTSVVHAIPGRIRLRVPTLKSAPRLAALLEVLLKGQPGMTNASVNSWCYSVTVTCDPWRWTPDALCAFLQPLRHEDIEPYELLRVSPDGTTDPLTGRWIQPSTYWKVVAYVALVMGIVLFALPMVPGGVPFLALSSFCFFKAKTLTSLEASTAE